MLILLINGLEVTVEEIPGLDLRQHYEKFLQLIATELKIPEIFLLIWLTSQFKDRGEMEIAYLKALPFNWESQVYAVLPYFNEWYIAQDFGIEEYLDINGSTIIIKRFQFELA